MIDFYIYDTDNFSCYRFWHMIQGMSKHFTGEVKHIKNYANFKWVCEDRLSNCFSVIVLFQILLFADIFNGFRFVRMLFLIWARLMKILPMMKLLRMFYCEFCFPIISCNSSNWIFLPVFMLLRWWNGLTFPIYFILFFYLLGQACIFSEWFCFVRSLD